MTDADVTARDGRRIARALVGAEARPEEVERWIAAVALRAAPLGDGADARLWRLARQGGAWTGLVDAGLALADPWSPVRHRLYLMLAVLEASPTHVAAFEAKDRAAAWTVLGLGLRGALAALRSVAGLALVATTRTLGR